MAVGLGLFIPLFSAIVPIQKALSFNLADSLGARKNQTKGSVVEISEKGKQNTVPYLIFGLISVLAGISIFYLLPLAILNFNIALILQIFFLILMGMILGLTLIAFNLQRILEAVIVNVVFFFERNSIKLLVKKNLVAHRESNKLTSIIYSLTLGSIIFVVVAANLQIKEIANYGSTGDMDLSVKANWPNNMTANIVDPVIAEYSYNI